MIVVQAVSRTLTTVSLSLSSLTSPSHRYEYCTHVTVKLELLIHIGLPTWPTYLPGYISQAVCSFGS